MRLRYWLPALLGVVALSLMAWSVSDGQVMAQNKNLSVFFTGDTDGEIVSCGCPVLDYGGASRKAAFFEKLRGAKWEFLTLDVGGIAPFKIMDSQMRLKTEALARSMSTMQYDAIALGDGDLALGKDFVSRMISWLGQPILATNYETGLEQVDHRVVTIQGRRVGLLAFLDPQALTEDHAWLQVEPWENQREQVEALRVDVDVLIAAAGVSSYSRMRDLAKLYPEINLILGSHRGDLSPELKTEGKTALLGAPPKGRFLGRAEVFFTPENKVVSVEGLALPVQEHWGAVPVVDTIVSDYYQELRTLITSDHFLEERLENLQEPLREYVGNQRCGSCHESQAAQWKETDHAHAKETLVEKGKDQVPECQSCHSTGNGFRTGFVTPATTPELWQVGCESCHGPGAGHVEDVKAPYGIIVEEACLDCHTQHDSPDFDYETYQPKIAH